MYNFFVIITALFPLLTYASPTILYCKCLGGHKIQLNVHKKSHSTLERSYPPLLIPSQCTRPHIREEIAHK